jgi:hypothetical protein
MTRSRLWISTVLTWFAARIAPRSTRAIFLAYARMLETFPDELRSGRTFGVITVPWSLSGRDHGKATLMQERAIGAAAEARKGIEVMTRASNERGVSEP